MGVIKGVQDEFPDAHVVGCLFHWKQALRKNMIRLRVPTNHIKVAMQPGVLDLLTVCARAKLEAAIEIVQAMVPIDGARKQWADFWKYFRCTWVKTYPFKTWNVSEMLTVNVELINRTNNLLESYNRYFCEKFPIHHPTLLHFLEVIKSEAVN